MPKLANHKDFWSGILFIGFGLGFLLLSPRYGIGTPSKMGPGFFPMLLGGLLILIGIVTTVRSFRGPVIRIDRMALGPLFLVAVSVVLFGLTVEWAGAAIAMILLGLIASLASPAFTLKSRIAVSVILTAFSIVVFIWGLGMPVPVMGSLFG